MNITAVVVTYNRKNLLLECIEGLRNQTYSVSKIIIVDNASSDGTKEVLTRLSGEISNLDYVRLDENLGGAGGFHTAIKKAYDTGADWIWVMDDDAEPEEKSLEIMLKSHAINEKSTLGLAQLKVGIDSNIQKVHRGHFNYKRISTIPLNDYEYSQKEIKIDYCSFVGLMISKHAIDLVGFPNKDYFIWYDDVEYCLRISSKGNIYLITDSIIKHKDSVTNSTSNRISISDYWKSYYGQRNIIDISKKHCKGFLPKLFLLYRFIKGIIEIIKYDDYKQKRLSLFLTAHINGILGKLGKQIDPVLYKKRL